MSRVADEPLDDFLRKYGDLRDELAVRRLRGDKLSQRESLVLRFINARLTELFEKPENESPQVTAAVEAASQVPCDHSESGEMCAQCLRGRYGSAPRSARA